jgi:putative redox protein
MPAATPRAFAIFAHCFTCSKNARAATHISRGLCDKGIAVLRFDFTGLGNSEGDFSNTDFSSNVDDLVAAAEALERAYAAPQLLIGHSLGGSAVLLAATRLESVKAVSTIGAPSDPAHVLDLFGEDAETIEKEGMATVELGGRSFSLTRAFVDDLRSQKLTDSLPTLRRALLVYHAPMDNVVSVEHARVIYENAKHPKSFLGLDNGDHLVSRPRDAAYIADTMAAWAGRYLDLEAEYADAAEIKPGEVLVRDRGTGMAQDVVTGKHRIVADEPEDHGGEDSGPNPYDLLLAALGTCTNMTLRMYADRKEWPLDEVQVRLRHERIHAEDCDDCETKEGKVSRMWRFLRVEGDLDDDQRQRLLEIANKCPVHRTLIGEISVQTDWDTT